MTFRKLGAALLVGAGLALAPLASASAATYPPAPITPSALSHTRVLVGQPVQFDACGYIPGDAVAVTLNGGSRGTDEAGVNGCIVRSFTFNNPGTDVISARDIDPRTVTLIVTVVPSGSGAGNAGGGGSVPGSRSGSGPASGSFASVLPFTGFDATLGLTAVVVLAGGGAFLRVAGRRRRVTQ